MTGVVLQAFTVWTCNACSTRARTTESRPHSEFHACPGMAGAWVPMIRDGEKVHVEVIERGDYVGKEKGLRFDGNGRPIMAARTLRDDGYDTAVFAPSARAGLRRVGNTIEEVA